MLKAEQELYEKLSIADIERTRAYARDLGNGLKTIRSFPQGVSIFGSARIQPEDKYYQKARELGQLLAQNGHAVITGGGPGIMEAANHGAYEYGGRSIGFNIALPKEQEPNAYLTDCLTFEYFFARKVMLAISGKVFVFFPGGFGTLDELSEILCLMQTNKMPKMPVFLFDKTFWKTGEKMVKKMASLQLIDPLDAKLFKITNNLNEIVRAANKIGHPKVSENYYDGFHEASALKK